EGESVSRRAVGLRRGRRAAAHQRWRACAATDAPEVQRRSPLPGEGQRRAVGAVPGAASGGGPSRGRSRGGADRRGVLAGREKMFGQTDRPRGGGPPPQEGVGPRRPTPAAAPSPPPPGGQRREVAGRRASG